LSSDEEEDRQRSSLRRQHLEEQADGVVARGTTANPYAALGFVTRNGRRSSSRWTIIPYGPPFLLIVVVDAAVIKEKDLSSRWVRFYVSFVMVSRRSSMSF